MKQRITYLLPHGTALDRADIKVGRDTLEYSNAVQAAQEWRLNLSLDEVPDELRVLLQDCQELHLKWASSADLTRVLPLVARTPPGFHAFFTPRSVNIDIPFCDFFRQVLDDESVKCQSVATSFSRPQLTSERVATSSTLQFFTYAPIGPKLSKFLLSKLCGSSPGKKDVLDACDSQLHELGDAAYIDLDFDAKSDEVVITASWDAPGQAVSPLARQRAKRPVRKVRADDRLEVGVLHVETADKADEIKLGGYLTVIGEDNRPDATLFSFPSRHHSPSSDLQTTFKATLQQPTGLHPNLDFTFLSSKSLVPPKASCGLHAYLTLPSQLFLDRYQLSDTRFLLSHKLLAMHMLSGEDDLEAPDWVLTRWGSAALFQLGHPTGLRESDADEPWKVTIPMHLRYLNGSSHATDHPSESTLEVPWPAVFWVCERDAGGSVALTTNPFDRVNLGYEGLFPPDTIFYHIPPSASTEKLAEKLTVPVLDAASAEWVPAGTLIAVMLGFVWICWKLFGAVDFTQRKYGSGGKAKKGKAS